MAQRVFCNRLVILAVTESSTGGFYGYFETFLEQIGMHNAYVKIGSYPTGPYQSAYNVKTQTQCYLNNYFGNIGKWAKYFRDTEP